MNLKKWNKLWRDTCPGEVKGLTMDKRRIKNFNKRLERSENRKRLAELNKHDKEKS